MPFFFFSKRKKKVKRENSRPRNAEFLYPPLSFFLLLLLLLFLSQEQLLKAAFETCHQSGLFSTMRSATTSDSNTRGRGFQIRSLGRATLMRQIRTMAKSP